jgi:small subunit ribosomal protein S17
MNSIRTMPLPSYKITSLFHPSCSSFARTVTTSIPNPSDLHHAGDDGGALPSSADLSTLFSTAQQLRQFSEDVNVMTEEQLLDYSTIPGFLSLLSHSLPKDKDSTPRQALVGRVVSDKMSKTVNVAVDRYRIVPKYRKRMKYTRKFMAHDEHEVCQEGDYVMIVPCQKLSKMKHFRVHSIVRAKGRL